MTLPGDEVFVVYEVGHTKIKVAHVYATEDDALRAKMDDLDPTGKLRVEKLEALAKAFIQPFKVETY